MSEALRERIRPQMDAAKDGPLGWLIFNNPERRNAISLAMWQAIPPLVKAFEDDPEIRVVVLRGAGEQAFAAGADISEFEAVRATQEAVRAYDEATDGAAAALVACRKPTVAMIHGFCMGGAVGLAMSCDLRMAAETGRFGIPAARLGVGYDYAGIKKLLDVVGPAFAKEIFFTGRQFSAQEAQAMQWINRVLPASQLEDTTRETALTIARNAPLSIQAVKTAVAEALKPSGERDLERCRQAVEACFQSDDYIEGRRAFMEKRPAHFKGS